MWVSPGETYLHNVEAIAHQLMRVRSGESRRLLISQPPRSLKSICVSVAYVAWLLGHDPTRHVIVASYSGDFAAGLHRQFRMVIASEWYAAVFPYLHLAKETGIGDLSQITSSDIANFLQQLTTRKPDERVAQSHLPKTRRQLQSEAEDRTI